MIPDNYAPVHRLHSHPAMMIWIALIPSLVASWLFVSTLRLRGAKAR